MNKGELLKIKDVAKRLQVSERSVFRYIHGKRLKASKIGHWKIKEQDLNNFIKKNSNYV